MKSLILMLSFTVLLTGFVTTVTADYPEYVPKTETITNELPDGHYLVMEITKEVQNIKYAVFEEFISLFSETDKEELNFSLTNAAVFDPLTFYSNILQIKSKQKQVIPELINNNLEESKNKGRLNLHYDPGSYKSAYEYI